MLDAREITDIHEELAKILLKRIRKYKGEAVITYGQLSREIDNKVDREIWQGI